MNKDYIFVQKKERAHLFPNIYVIGRNYTLTIQQLLDGVSFGDTLVEIKNGVMHWYASVQGLKQSGEKAMEKIHQDPDFIAKIRKKFEKIAPEMNVFTEKVFVMDLEALSNRKIWQIFEQYLQLYEKIYLWGEPIVLVLDESLGGYLKEYLRTRIKDKKKINQIYNLLISPRERSFVKREEDELINIAIKIKNGQIKDIDKALAKHTEKYCWIPYDYGIYLWDERYFKTIIDKLLQQKNLQKKIKKSNEYFRSLKHKQKEILKELEVDQYHQKLFCGMRDAAYLQDYKKEIFTKSHYHMNYLLEETARRFGVEKKYLQYYLPLEMKQALLHNKRLSKVMLTKRYKHSVLQWHGDNIWYVPSSAKFLKEFLQQDTQENIKLDGMIASAGKYIGRVKVVNSAAQIGKVHQGDIMVTAMTSPEYVPAMRKAGAIITDQGGVMCHAAIVSRELGVPCVVGTRQATKILKDGETVEVNANHNSVKILRR